MDKQIHSYRLITDAHTMQMSFQRDVIDERVESVKKEYYANVNAIIKYGDEQRETKLNEKDEYYRDIIASRQNELDELYKEKVELINDNETLRKNNASEQTKLQKECEKLIKSRDAINHEISLLRDLLEQQKKSNKSVQSALEESLKGDLNTAKDIAYRTVIEERNAFQTLLNDSIRDKNALESEIIKIRPDFLEKEKELISRIEELEIYIDKIIVERDKFRRGKESTETSLKELREKYVTIFNEHVKMEGREGILNAAKDELIRDKDEEIKKCNRLRSEKKELIARIEELNKDLIGYADLRTKFNRVKRERGEFLDDNNVLNENQAILEGKVQELIKQLEASKIKIDELNNKSYFDKIKLMSVLAIDSTRNYLPKEIWGWDLHKTINNLETALLVSEITDTGTKVSWIAAASFIVGIWLIGMWKFFAGLFKSVKWLGRLVTGNGNKDNSEVSPESDEIKPRPRVNGRFVKVEK